MRFSTKGASCGAVEKTRGELEAALDTLTKAAHADMDLCMSTIEGVPLSAPTDEEP